MRRMLTLTSMLALSAAAASTATAGPFVESARFTDGFGVVRISAGNSSGRDLVSRDAGRTFRQLPEPGGDTNELVLLPSGLGYRTAASGRLWRTGDGGHHWQRVPLASGISGLEAVGTGVWALRAAEGSDGPVRLVASQDGGRTWTSRPTPVGIGPDGPDGGLAFADAADGVVTGRTANGRLILRVTRDGGRTWTRRRAPCSAGWTPSKGAPLVRWLPSGAMWFLCVGASAGGNSPLELHQSFDGGRTFVLRSRTARTAVFGAPRPQVGRGLGGSGGYPGGFDALDAEKAVLRTVRGVTRTTDGGRTWTARRHLPVASEQLFDFDVDGRTRWLSRGTAGLLRSDDAGRRWERVSTTSR